MNFIESYEEILYGNIDNIINVLNDFNVDEKRAYIEQYVKMMFEFNNPIQNMSVHEITNNILSYPNDKIAEFVFNTHNYLSYVHRVYSIRRLNVVMQDIAINKGNLSVYNAFAQNIKAKNFSHDAISTSLSQSLKLLYTYKFALTQESIKKLVDSDDFLNDPRFIEIINQIKQYQTTQYNNEDIVRMIRNGIAHCNYKDNSQLDECKNIDELEQNMYMKISNKTNHLHLYIDFASVLDLMDLAQEYIKEIPIKSIDKYYQPTLDTSLPLSMQFIATKKSFDSIIDNRHLNSPELKALNKFKSTSSDVFYSPSGFFMFMTALDYPEYHTIMNIDSAINVVKDLNRGRKKQQKSKFSEIGYSVPTMIISRMFDVLTTLKDLNLIKGFVSENLNNQYMARIPLFNKEQKPTIPQQIKSISNKFRLLRNCLAHSYMFNYGNSIQAFDIDESHTTIDLDEISLRDLTMLCEDIENYISRYYEQSINNNPIIKSKYVM